MRLLSQADPEPAAEPGPVAEERGTPPIQPEDTAFLHAEQEYRTLQRKTSDDSSVASQTDVDQPSISIQGVDRTDPKFFYSFPNSPSQRANELPQASSSTVASGHQSEEEDDDALEFPGRRHFVQPTATKWQSRRRRFRRRTVKALKSFNDFMTVPLWAALASLVVACIQPLQHALDEHVQPIKGALTQAGNCSIPLTLVVLGAYFYSPPDPEEIRSRAALPTSQRRGRSLSTTWSQLSLVDNVREMFKMKRRSPSEAGSRRHAKKRPGESKTVVIAVLSRMIITPLLLLPVMALSTRFNLQEVFEEYVILFI